MRLLQFPHSLANYNHFLLLWNYWNLQANKFTNKYHRAEASKAETQSVGFPMFFFPKSAKQQHHDFIKQSAKHKNKLQSLNTIKLNVYKMFSNFQQITIEMEWGPNYGFLSRETMLELNHIAEKGKSLINWIKLNSLICCQ